MPELPEVETMCRGLAPIVGRRVLRAERTKCTRKPISIEPRIDAFSRRAEGKTVVAIERAGKRVVIWLGENSGSKKSKQASDDGTEKNDHSVRGEEAIVIEPRMTGLVLLADPPTSEHLRFRMMLDSARGSRAANGKVSVNRRGDQMLFWDRRGLGCVKLLTAAEFAAKFDQPVNTGEINGVGSKGKRQQKPALGPDALRLTAEQLRQQLSASRRAIKVALLDQRAVAGIGNLYASEILHLAGVHPAARCDRLRVAQWIKIHAAMLEVLNAAIQHEGSTLSDGTYRNTLNENGGYQNHHRVYDRAGEKCPTCRKSTIVRIVQAQRSTFYCPGCQRR
jgi:formamidopyrimidine-DNA glycosylase